MPAEHLVTRILIVRRPDRLTVQFKDNVAAFDGRVIASTENAAVLTVTSPLRGPKIDSRSVFINQWRRRKWVVSRKRERCHRQACRVALVRIRPSPKPNRSHSCDKHRCVLCAPSMRYRGEARRSPIVVEPYSWEAPCVEYHNRRATASATVSSRSGRRPKRLLAEETKTAKFLMVQDFPIILGNLS
jgi:hypothetical protein